MHYRKAWTDSSMCKCLQFLMISSIEASVMIIGIITLDRMLTLIYPLRFLGGMSRKLCKTLTLLTLLVCTCLGILSVLGVERNVGATSTSAAVCMPFYLLVGSFNL